MPVWTADLKNYLTAKQAAHRAGFSKWALYRRIGQPGGPPCLRRGRFWLFPKAQFEPWADQQEIP